MAFKKHKLDNRPRLSNTCVNFPCEGNNFKVSRYVLEDILIYAVWDKDNDMSDEFNFKPDKIRFRRILEETLSLSDSELVEQVLLFLNEETYFDRDLCLKVFKKSTEWQNKRLGREVPIYLTSEIDDLLNELVDTAQ